MTEDRDKTLPKIWGERYCCFTTQKTKFNYGNYKEKLQEPRKRDDRKVYGPAGRCKKRRHCSLIPRALMMWAGAGRG